MLIVVSMIALSAGFVYRVYFVVCPLGVVKRPQVRGRSGPSHAPAVPHVGLMITHLLHVSVTRLQAAAVLRRWWRLYVSLQGRSMTCGLRRYVSPFP
jgi:hypothetical protein